MDRKEFSDFCDRPALELAPLLIGAAMEAFGSSGMIVETEAYEPDDPASHSFRGATRRNASMFGRPGTAYVYRSYGLHWCVNVVARPGSAVLIRALEPRWGIDAMRRRRGVEDLKLLCAGPGRVCQALGIDGGHDGLPINGGPVFMTPASTPHEIVAGLRVGISRAVDHPWRFGLSGSPFVSRRFPQGPRSTSEM